MESPRQNGGVMRKSFSAGKERARGVQRERIPATLAGLVQAPGSTAADQARPCGDISFLPRLAPLPVRRSSAAQRRSAARRETAELAHDARNLLSALSLYCELLSGPGVLAPGFRHYAEDLRVVGETGARLVEALANPAAASDLDPRLPLRRRPFPGIEDLAAEVLALESLMRALAGPAVRFEIECAPCAGLLALNSEDLLRILFNLVANSVEAMGTLTATPGWRALLRVTAQRGGGSSFLTGDAANGFETVVLSVRDNGPGIAAKDLERIFDPGFSTRANDREISHGLGLAIVRQLTEAAGGTVRAVSSPGLGTRFDIELPVVAEGRAFRPELASRRRSGEPSQLEKG